MNPEHGLAPDLLPDPDGSPILDIQPMELEYQNRVTMVITLRIPLKITMRSTLRITVRITMWIIEKSQDLAFASRKQMLRQESYAVSTQIEPPHV